MSARELVLEQLESLKKEKDNLVDQVLAAEAEAIEELKRKAAEQAEAEYREEVEVKVAHQFRIAEEHLNKLLSELPEETHEETSESETDTEEQSQI